MACKQVPLVCIAQVDWQIKVRSRYKHDKLLVAEWIASSPPPLCQPSCSRKKCLIGRKQRITLVHTDRSSVAKWLRWWAHQGLETITA